MTPTPYYDDGQITIYCGDCRDVLPSLEAADLVLTDPPYSDHTHTNVRSNSRKATLGNRVMNFAPLTHDDLTGIYGELGRVARRWVVSTMDHTSAFAFDQTPPPGLRMMRIGVWLKTNPMPQISADRPAQGWEAITYMHRDDTPPRWNGGVRAGNFRLPTAQGFGHPTAKPPAMMNQLIQWFSEPDDLVLDPFMGSGTTLRAAKDLGRRAIGIELEEKYCEIAVRRLAQQVLPFGDVA